jgi:hypothetical protein
VIRRHPPPQLERFVEAVQRVDGRLAPRFF